MPRNTEEENDCIAFADYLTLRKITFSHLAQSTPAVTKVEGIWHKNWKTITRNTDMGVHKGVPDYIIILERPKGILCHNFVIFLEMKKKKGGVVSDEQKDWIIKLNEVFGVYATVAYGFDDAVKIIEQFINKPGDAISRHFKTLKALGINPDKK